MDAPNNRTRCDGAIFNNPEVTVAENGDVYLNGVLCVVDGSGRVEVPNLRDHEHKFFQKAKHICERIGSRERAYYVNRLALYTYYYHRRRTIEEFETGICAELKDPALGIAPNNVRWSDEQDGEPNGAQGEQPPSNGNADKEEKGNNGDEGLVHPAPPVADQDVNTLISKLIQSLALSPGDQLQVTVSKEEGGAPQVEVFVPRRQ